MKDGPEAPYLVIRGDRQAYRVHAAPDADVTATVQALEEGCYAGALCYDTAGELWPVTDAAFVSPPSPSDRLAPWRRHPVRLTFGSPRRAPVDEVVAQLALVLVPSNPAREEPDDRAADLLARLRTASSPAELIEVARGHDASGSGR